MPTLPVNDIQVYYEIRGEGEPLLLILGLGTDVSEWDGVIDSLARHLTGQRRQFLEATAAFLTG